MGEGEPVVRVVRGDPTAEELAALIGVLLARAAPPPPVVSDQSQWVRTSRPGSMVGGLPVGRGPHQWRGSALPR